MENYFVEVCNSVPDFPIYLYNIPQCSANDLPVDVAEKVAKRCANAIGIKYSFADINKTIDYLNINDGDFSVLHGLDRALVSLLAAGCEGTVSGISCVFPEPFIATYKAYMEGDLKKAQAHQKVCVQFCDALKRGSNMSYFKEALKLRGINGGFMRAPQINIESAEIEDLKNVLEEICQRAHIPFKLS